MDFCLTESLQHFVYFCLVLFLGAIFALTVHLIILLGCVFPGPMQTSGTYNLKCPRLYNLNHCLNKDFYLLSEDSCVELWTSLSTSVTSRTDAESKKPQKSLNNAYNLWIFILVRYCVTSRSALFLPARQSIENVFIPVSAVPPCLHLPSQ